MNEERETLDLNLIRIFVAVHEAGSVSKAAEMLLVAQPSVSYALRRLREEFGDALFVRNGRGVSATPLADQLYLQFRDALTIFDNALESTQSFDATTSHRTFRVAMSDVGAICLVPPLQERIRELAPDVTLEIVQVTVDQTMDELSAGKLDIAIGNLPLMHHAARSELLFPERYVCVISETHPRVGAKITAEQFMAERHIVVNSPYSLHQRVEEHFRDRGIRRRAALRLPHYGILPSVLSNNDYLVTMPSSLGAVFLKTGGVRCLELPVKIPTFEIRCLWHARQNNNPANIWLRTAAISTLSKLSNE
jgi:DNA-binding transcriptional LysR family regulator